LCCLGSTFQVFLVWNTLDPSFTAGCAASNGSCGTSGTPTVNFIPRLAPRGPARPPKPPPRWRARHRLLGTWSCLILTHHLASPPEPRLEMRWPQTIDNVNRTKCFNSMVLLPRMKGFGSTRPSHLTFCNTFLPGRGSARFAIATTATKMFLMRYFDAPTARNDGGDELVGSCWDLGVRGPRRRR
jgi:hypothetical protein